MIRAIQSADIIKKSLEPDLPVVMDEMLKEGAPIPPEPPVGHWRPLFYVTLIQSINLNTILLLRQI